MLSLCSLCWALLLPIAHDHNLSTDREAQTALGRRGKGGGGGLKQLGIQCSWIFVIACLVGVLIDHIVCSLCFAVDVPVRCTVA